MLEDNENNNGIFNTVIALIFISIFLIVIFLGGYIVINSLGSTEYIVNNLNETSSSSQIILTSSTDTLTPIGDGITSSSISSYNNTWLNFDGVDDVINTTEQNSYQNLSNGFTLSIWVNTVTSNITSTSDSSYLSISNKSSFPSIRISIRDTSDVAQFKIRMITNSTCDTSKSTTGFAKNDLKWHHLVGVYNGSNIIIYIDGVLNGSSALPVVCNKLLSEVGALNYNYFVGSSIKTVGHSKAILDEARAYNRTLTDAEILEIYNSGRVSNSSLSSDGLVLWYSFNEGSGTIAYDKSGNLNHGTLTNFA